MPLLQAQFARKGLQALHVPEGWHEFHFVGMPLIHDEIDLHAAFPLVVIHLGLSGKGGKNGVLEQGALAHAREPVQQARIAKIYLGRISYLGIPAAAEWPDQSDQVSLFEK